MASTSESTGPSDTSTEGSNTSESSFRKINYSWTIHDLKSTFKDWTQIESPKFASMVHEDVEWYIYLNLAELKEGNTLDVRVMLRNTRNIEIPSDVNISFFDSSRKITQFINNTFKYGLIQNSLWTIPAEKLYKMLLNDEKLLPENMTVVCNITYLDCCKKEACKDRKQRMEAPLNSENVTK